MSKIKINNTGVSSKNNTIRIENPKKADISHDVINQITNEITGDIMFKDNTEPFTPDNEFEPATKKYVDESVIPIDNIDGGDF